MTENPTKFEDIDPDVLRRQAVEDWAVEVKPSDSLKKVLKALDDAGIDWDIYADKYGYGFTQDASDLDAPSSVEPIATPAPAPTQGAVAPQHDVNQRVPEPQRAGAAVTAASMQAGYEPAPAAAPAQPVILTAQPLPVQEEAKYLVKMERANERYSHGKYTWTKKHPYALVDAKDFEAVLRHEPGFRQAYPSELQEFYG